MVTTSKYHIDFDDILIQCTIHFFVWNIFILLVYIFAVAYVLYKSRRHLSLRNHICTNFFVFIFLIRIISISIMFSDCHTLKVEVDTSEDAWNRYYGQNIYNRIVQYNCDVILMFIIFDFIIKMKSFWDYVYFDKISYIYNT